MHLDLGAADGGRHAEAQRPVRLGATALGERGGPGVFAWTRLTEPEGNEFCVGENGG